MIRLPELFKKLYNLWDDLAIMFTLNRNLPKPWFFHPTRRSVGRFDLYGWYYYIRVGPFALMWTVNRFKGLDALRKGNNEA